MFIPAPEIDFEIAFMLTFYGFTIIILGIYIFCIIIVAVVKLTDEKPTMSELMNVVAKPLGTDWHKVSPIK